MKKPTIFFCLILMSVLSLKISALPLVNGSVHRDLDSFTKEQIFMVWNFEDWASEKFVSGFQSIISYNESASMTFVLSRSLNLGVVDTDSSSYLGSWPLTRWAGESSDTKFNRFTLPYTDNSFGNELRLQIDNSKKGLGCLNETPLRYGDINNDQSNEIVLLLGELNHTLDFVVFSPEQEKTIFGARLALHDSQDNEYGEYSNYDYIATLDLRSAYQAYRSYAKVFLIDLDADKTTPDDILVWRKAFFANHKDNPVKGFSLDGSLLSHFAYVEGEYALQETAESDIRNWLAENNLTWSKGYPSKSECPGEEGQLIPEMHDPLLNDPDVLK